MIKQKKNITLTYLAVCMFFVNTLTAQTTQPKEQVLVAKNEVNIKKGKALIAKSDCVSCHKPTIKLIGPSFKQISTKYPSTVENYDFLVHKIIKGGGGNWGPMRMSPHTNLAVEDAEKMVSYILSVQ